MNIRNKLALQFSAIFALLLGIVLVTIYYISFLGTRSEFYDRLEDRAYISANFFLEEDELNKERFKAFERKYLQKSLPDEIVQIYNADNQPQFIAANTRLRFNDRFLERIREEKKVRMLFNHRQLVGVHYRDNEGDYIIIATAIDQYGNSKMENLRFTMLFSYILSLLVIYLFGRFFSKKALEPMAGVLHQVQQISASNLNLRVSEGNGKDEIAELAITFNRMLERLEHAFDLQRTFVNNASHELRTPLSIIIGEIEVLLSRARSQSEYQATLQAILQEAEQLNLLVNMLLSFAQAGREGEPHIDTVRLDELLWEISEDMNKKHPDVKLRIEMDNLPTDAEKLSIPGNHPLLFSALSNIVDNAIKFSRGKPVDCKLIYQDDKVIVLIEDKGIGISGLDIKNLFQPFFRAGNARTFHGHGLGLALAQRIIRMHKGNIFVQSQENVGTIFRLEFPLPKF